MDIGVDRKEIGNDHITYENILKYVKNGEHISIETADKLLQYENAVLLFMSSKDIYVLANKYKELYNERKS